MLKITKRAKAISPSLTLAITAKAKKLKAEGVDVIGFGAGEPDFNTPDYIIEAAKKALDIGFTKYTPSAGMPELRKAISEKFAKDNGLNYLPEQIVVSNGAKQSLFNCFQVIVEEGDEVILPTPYWLTYPELIRICGGTPVAVRTDASSGYKMTAEQLKNAITDKTVAVVLNSPNNPTGAVYTKDELQAIADVLKQFPDVYVIADEIYEKLVYDGYRRDSFAALGEDAYRRTFTINGFSKAYSMTGWRVGYVGAPTAELAKAMDGLQSHESSNANSIAQYASVVALSGGEDFMRSMNETYDRRHKLMMRLLNDTPFVQPVEGHGTFYVMADVSEMFGKSFEGTVIRDAIHLGELLIDHAKIAVIPMTPFGEPNCIRLSYAISDENIAEGCRRLKVFAESLKSC